MADKINIVMSLSGDDEGALSLLKQVEARMAQLETATKQAGQNINKSLREATSATKDLSSGASSASKNVTDTLNNIQASGKQVTEQLRLARDAFMAFAGVKFLAGQVKNIMDMADAYGQMTSRIKIVTKETGNYNQVVDDLQRISQLTYKRFTDNAEIYVRTEKTMREMGFATEETMGVVEALSTSLVISGANVQMNDGAINTLSKSLQLGYINLKAFQTLTANSPRLLQALADGLGVTGQELQKMARAGQLTSDKVVPALTSQLEKLRKETEAMPVSIADASVKFGNAMLFWVGKTDSAIGASKTLTTIMGVLADNIDLVMITMTGLGALITVTLARTALPHLMTAFRALGATASGSAALARTSWETVNATLLRTSVAARTATVSVRALSVALLSIVAPLLAVALIAYEFGKWANKFEIVRQAGIAFVLAYVKYFEVLRTAWEYFRAIFTDDTFAEVTERHRQRVEAMNNTFSDMFRDTSAEAYEAAKSIETAQNALTSAATRGVEVLDVALKEVDKAIKDVEKRYGDASKQVTASLSAISSAYADLSGMAERQMNAEIAALEQRYALEIAELERVTESKSVMMKKSSALLAELLATETAMQQKNTEQMLALIDAEGVKRIEAAKKMAETDAERVAAVKKVENEILETKRATLEKQVEDYKKHIDTLNAEEQKHLDAIVAIEEKKRQARMSADEKIRDLQRKLMTDYEVYQDKQTEISELQSKAREALAKGEYDKAVEYAQKMESVAVSTAGAVKDGDKIIVDAHAAVAAATDNIRIATDLATRAYTAEQAVHQGAAESAVSSRKEIERALGDTQAQVQTLSKELAAGLNLSVEMNIESFDEGLKKVDAALAEKERLLPIKLNLESAKRDLDQMLKDIENGLAVNIDLTKAKESLAALGEYAENEGRVELQVATTEAESAIDMVETKIVSLNNIQTQSKHEINSNVNEVKKEVKSLDGLNTSSVHTTYNQTVNRNNTGGLISAQHLNKGGVAGFPAMHSGIVPGVGDTDTVPRTLDAGSFVLRKAAVQRYRGMLGISRFAGGGGVKKSDRTDDEKEVYKMLSKLNSAGKGLPPVQAGSTSMSDWAWRLRNKFWSMDSDKRQQVVSAVQEGYEGWMRNLKIAHSMNHPVAMGLNMLALLALNQGGNAPSGTGTDTVPAMLTPGEWVVPRDTVKRFGVEFFSMLNSMREPASALGGYFQRFAAGGLAIATNGPSYPHYAPTEPLMHSETPSAPTRTINLRLSIGGTEVTATTSESDGEKLLAAIARAKSNAK